MAVDRQDKNRMKVLSSALHMDVMSLQLYVPRLCKSVCENLGCIPEQRSNSFYYCFVFITMLAVNMASARLFFFLF